VPAGATGSSASRTRVAIQYRRLLMRHWSDLEKEGVFGPSSMGIVFPCRT